MIDDVKDSSTPTSSRTHPKIIGYDIILDLRKEFAFGCIVLSYEGFLVEFQTSWEGSF